MAKYKTEASKETIQEANKLAKANQRPGQTKEQTKLIALGIQKGIEQYKKKQKSRSRELDKKLKAINHQVDNSTIPDEELTTKQNDKKHLGSTGTLAWILLICSWIGFSTYIYLT